MSRYSGHHHLRHKYFEIYPITLLQSDIASGWYLDTHLPICTENDLGTWPILQENDLITHWFSAKDHQNPSLLP